MPLGEPVGGLGRFGWFAPRRQAKASGLVRRPDGDYATPHEAMNKATGHMRRAAAAILETCGPITQERVDEDGDGHLYQFERGGTAYIRPESIVWRGGRYTFGVAIHDISGGISRAKLPAWQRWEHGPWVIEIEGTPTGPDLARLVLALMIAARGDDER